MDNTGYEKSAKFYDLFADNSDIPFYKKIAKKTGSPVLDVATGTGRVAIPLTADGHKVVGIDSSKTMLAEAKKKIKSSSHFLQKNLTFMQAPMEKFSLKQKNFALILIPSSFGHAMTTEDQVRTLNTINNHLANNGTFILDIYCGEKLEEKGEWIDTEVPYMKNTRVRRKGTYKACPEQKMRYELVFEVLDGTDTIIETVKEESWVRIIYDHEVDSLLKQTGFIIKEEFGDFNMSPFTTSSDKRIMILQKIK